MLHRPLIHYGVPPLARLLAQRQHLAVAFELSGSIFTNLRVTNLRVTPSGSGPTPVERIQIDTLRLDYSLWKLAREGLGEFLSSYELRHADLAFIALPSQTPEEKKAKTSLAETLRTVLAQPAAYADRVTIEDFNLTVRSPEAETQLRGLDLQLDPHKPGHLRLARLAVPGLPVWENLRAETSYAQRNLFQRGLRLGPQIEIEELNFDASRRLEGEGSIALKARVLGGHVTLSLAGEETGAPGEHLKKQYATRLKVAMQGVRVREAAAYFGVPGVPLERLAAFDLDFTGDPEKPRTWRGTARVEVENITSGALTIPRVQSAADFKDGVASFQTSGQLGENAAQVEAHADLPEDVAGFLDTGLEARIELLARDLPAVITPLAPETQTSGTLLGNGTLKLRERRAAAQFEFSGKDLAFNQAGLALAALRIEAGTALDGQELLRSLEATVTLDAQQLHAGSFGLDTAKLAATLSQGTIRLRELTVTRGANRIDATGQVTLPAEQQPVSGTGQLNVQAPGLAEFGIAAGGKTLEGKLATTAQVKFAGQRIDGEVRLDGGPFQLGEFQTGPLAGRIAMRGSEVQIESLTLALNEHDRLAVQGRYFTAEHGRYDGTLNAGLRDLAVLDPLLRLFGVQEPLRGALDIAWKGAGTAQAAQHHGEASVTLRAAAYGPQKLDELRLSGHYSEAAAQAELQAAAGPTRLGTQIVWAEKRIALRDLELRQGAQRALTGDLGLSLATPNGEKLDPLRQPLSVSLHADQLDLEKLLTSLGQPAPASGKLTLHLAASGTARRPELQLRIEGRALRAKAAAQFDPADLDVALDYLPGALSLKAGLRQPLIQPIEITARAPLDVEQVIDQKKLDRAMPLAAAVKLPPTSLAVLPKLVPAVRRIEGTAALDVRAEGTLAKPVLDGALVVALKNARLASESVPAIGQFDAQLAFDADTVKFTKFRGEVGGGTFDLLGRIELAQFDNPVFDLRAEADKVLVLRDDSITVRADADVKIAGPLEAGTLAGEIFLTQSRFFKEIDILPIGLPGRPKPAPKSAPSNPDIALPPPLDKWKIDLAVKTREADPFLIRGNLANGQVAMNLRVGNTGATPWVEGAVTIDRFAASLPFSTLTLDNGKVLFTKNAPLTQPTLDLQAQSKVRDYTVNAFIFGQASEPQIQFTSEPPLPHADIVSLLATGTTTSEITGNADVLASRAAMLAVQSLWKKLFGKGKAAPAPSANPRGAPGFADRFELELGAVDHKTGAREATAKYKVNDQIYILGELDTQGRYTGSLKYLLRFR